MKKIFLILAAVLMAVSVSAQGIGGGNGPGGMPPGGMGPGGMGQGGPGKMKGMPPRDGKGKSKGKKPRKPVKLEYVYIPKMYAYAVGVLDGDSVVYASDILEMDSVQVVKSNGFLVNRQDYSSQFKNYLATNLGQQNRTCAIVFNKNRNSLVSDFEKLKKYYLKKKQLVQVIDPSLFQFTVTNN